MKRTFGGLLLCLTVAGLGCGGQQQVAQRAGQVESVLGDQLVMTLPEGAAPLEGVGKSVPTARPRWTRYHWDVDGASVQLLVMDTSTLVGDDAAALAASLGDGGPNLAVNDLGMLGGLRVAERLFSTPNPDETRHTFAVYALRRFDGRVFLVAFSTDCSTEADIDTLRASARAVVSSVQPGSVGPATTGESIVIYRSAELELSVDLPAGTASTVTEIQDAATYLTSVARTISADEPPHLGLSISVGPKQIVLNDRPIRTLEAWILGERQTWTYQKHDWGGLDELSVRVPASDVYVNAAINTLGLPSEREFAMQVMGTLRVRYP